MTLISSGNPMDLGGDNTYLPPEIIINILKRLPVKYILRFTSVCKVWRNLLKSPYFIEDQRHHSAHNNRLLTFYAFDHSERHSNLCLLCHKMETMEVVRIPKMDPLVFVCGIVGSYNGLLCVEIADNEWSRSLLVLNPATREVRRVPKRTIDHSWLSAVSECGFGFSLVARDYKIVRIYPKVSDGLIRLGIGRVDVFSLRTDSWKEVDFGAIQSLTFDSKCVHVNGAIFWLGWEHESLRIVSFDLAMEVFTLIPISPSISNICRDVHVYENKVAVFDLHYGHEYDVIDLWVLEEVTYGKSWDWTKKYSIRPTLLTLYPICFWRNEIVFESIRRLKDDSIHLFSLTADNKWKKFNIPYRILTFRIFEYAESLVSLCVNNHVD